MTEQLSEASHVWLGDLSGMEVVPVVTIGPDGPEARLELRHRLCDDRWPIPEDGIAADGSAYAANIAVQAREALATHACTVRERSAEHQDRVARWLTAANLPHTGDPVRDQLALVRNISQAVRPAGMTEAEMDTKLEEIGRRLVHGSDVDAPAAAAAIARAARARRLAHGPVTVECLGDSCTGCSDPQCWTARADGGDV